jgi:anti-sigma B factor antagonist
MGLSTLATKLELRNDSAMCSSSFRAAMTVRPASEFGWDLHPQLEVWVHRAPDHVLVTLSGRLTADVAGRLRQVLAPLTEEGRQRVAVDISRIALVDPVGLGVLAGAHKRARSNTGDVQLLHPSAAVRRAIDSAGLSGLLPTGCGIASTGSGIAQSRCSSRLSA